MSVILSLRVDVDRAYMKQPQDLLWCFPSHCYLADADKVHLI